MNSAKWHLFQGNTYYPAGGLDDLTGSYETKLDALSAFDRRSDWAHIARSDADGNLRVVFCLVEIKVASAQYEKCWVPVDGDGVPDLSRVPKYDPQALAEPKVEHKSLPVTDPKTVAARAEASARISLSLQHSIETINLDGLTEALFEYMVSSADVWYLDIEHDTFWDLVNKHTTTS